MANTIKTMTGEILVSEVEAVITDNIIQGINLSKITTKVVVVGKTGVKYDLTTALPAAQALKVLNAATTFVAGVGHTVFDPTQVK